MTKSLDTSTQVQPDGLRYVKKVKGSAYATVSQNTQSVMSCFRCGRHRPREMMVFKRMFGRSHLVCEPTCEEVAQRLSSG